MKWLDRPSEEARGIILFRKGTLSDGPVRWRATQNVLFAEYEGETARISG